MAVTTHSLPFDPEDWPAETPHERLRRSGGWLTLLLALAMLISVAASVQAADWTSGLGVIQSVILGAVLTGFLLSLSSFSSLFSFVYSLLASVAWITHLLVRSFIEAENLHDGVIRIIDHNIQWFSALFSGSASGDNLMFVIQLCFLGWWMAYFAMWSLFSQQRVWYAVVPAATAMLVNAYYAPNDVSGYVIAFLVIVLLLAIRVELARNETRWQMAQIRYAPDMYLDFLKAGMVFAAIVVAAAWIMPDMTAGGRIDKVIEPLRRPWTEVQDTWQRMFGSLNYRAGAYVSTYGKSLSLGGPVTLTDRPVFEAQVPMRSYWRGATFDTYTGQQWLNTDQEVLTFDQGRSFTEPFFLYTAEMTATIRSLEDGQTVLFGPPQPVRASVPVDADVTVIGSSTASGNPEVQVSLLRSRAWLGTDSVYQVVSRVTNAPAELLRLDHTDYPDWIDERYLQVPEDLPRRVRRLAQRLTEGYDNPYDKATAVEAYLRTIRYDTQIAAPPPGTDAVSYFLFEVEAGYCDYYASAMAMLLRSQGIPARFVAGYAPGNYNEETNRYIVREDNAHAWVEVFFPSYGWVQFEPTASEPNISRPAPLPEQAPGTEALDPGLYPGQEFRNPWENEPMMPEPLTETAAAAAQVSWFTGLRRYMEEAILLLLVLAAAAGAWAVIRKRERSLLSPDANLLVRLFGLLALWAGRLRIPWPASHTPLEHAHAFSRVMPEAEQPVQHLAGLLAAQQYGRQVIATETLASTAREWREIQPVLWRRWAARVLNIRRRRAWSRPEQDES